MDTEDLPPEKGEREENKYNEREVVSNKTAPERAEVCFTVEIK